MAETPDERMREAQVERANLIYGLRSIVTSNSDLTAAERDEVSQAADILAAQPLPGAGAEPVAWYYQYEDGEQDAVALDRWLPENRGGWIERPLVFGDAEPIRQEAAEPDCKHARTFTHRSSYGKSMTVCRDCGETVEEAAEPSEETLRAMYDAWCEARPYSGRSPGVEGMRRVFAIAHKGAA